MRQSTLPQIPFMKVYRLMELQGVAFNKALRNLIDFYTFAKEEEPDNIVAVIQFAEYEDILFHEEGEMVGVDE